MRGAEGSGMEVAHLRRLDGNGKTRAFCDVSVSGILIKGFRVVDGKKGLFVGMPQQQGKDGKWYEVVSPIDEEIRTHLATLILEAYEGSRES